MATTPLQYRLDGPRHAPAVLLVPAFGTKLSVWEPQMPALVRSRRVLRVNHRGHGSTPAPEGPYTVESLALDLLTLLDEHGVDRVSAAGSGLGAALVLWLAANAPHRVDRLVLFAAAPRTPLPETWEDLAARVRRGGLPAVTADVIRPWFTPDFADRHPEIEARLAADFEKLDPSGFAACCEAVAAMDQRHLIAAVEADTLVVSAAHDPLVPPGHGRRLAGGIAHSRFEVVSGAAHLLGVERADRVSELLVEHLVA